MSANNDVLLKDALLEDNIVTLWPDYPCLYDVRSVDFRSRDLRQQVMEAIGEQLDQTSTDFENATQVAICIYPGYWFATCQMELRELKTFDQS